MDLYKRVLRSNRKYWRAENGADITNGILLYDNYYDSDQLCYGISKVALCIAKSLNLVPAVLLPWKKSKMSESMCRTRFQLRRRLPFILVSHCRLFLLLFFSLDRTKLLSLNDKGIVIGKYIYDAILRRYNKKTIDRISLKERCYILLELSYFYFFKYVLSKNNIKVVVLGDNVYRYGLLFELCKVYNITCFTPINLDTLFLRCYRTKADYETSYLTLKMLNQICEGKEYRLKVEEYYSKRYSGGIEQHDVLTAYANKHISDKEEFCNRYMLDPQKKTVVIMSHVFADAPHVNLNTLYDDYWEWFVDTLECLVNNKSINLLVKEHPSSHLFGQKGLVKDYLKAMNLENHLVLDDESTLSIIQNADAIVTCGGTIGIEMSYVGKNVIVASNPSYSKLGITKEFESKGAYEDFLINKIQDIKPLSEELIDIARKVSYVCFCCQDNWIEGLEIGPEKTLLGRVYDNDKLYEAILQYNRIALENQIVYKILDGFVKSPDRAMFNFN